MDLDVIRSFMMLGGSAVGVIALIAMVCQAYREAKAITDKTESPGTDTRLDLGTALAAAMAAYVSALLGLDSTPLARVAEVKLDWMNALAHAVLVLGYFAAVVIAFVGAMKAKWGPNTPALLRSVVGTGLGVVVAIIGFLSIDAAPDPGGGSNGSGANGGVSVVVGE